MSFTKGGRPYRAGTPPALNKLEHDVKTHDFSEIIFFLDSLVVVLEYQEELVTPENFDLVPLLSRPFGARQHSRFFPVGQQYDDNVNNGREMFQNVDTYNISWAYTHSLHSPYSAISACSVV